MGMTPEHLTIGTFARLCGLTSSALRFYDDSGLLTPADVDASSGYRYYLAEQIPTAVLLRQLREAGMSLGDIRMVLDDPDPASTSQRLDRHLADLTQRLADARAAAEQVRATIGHRTEPFDGASTSGPLFASACASVLPASVADAELPVLDSVLVEVEGATLTLTATDRYRLASRTLHCPDGDEQWSSVLPAPAVRDLADWARRRHRITLNHNAAEVVVTGDGHTRRLPVLDVEFPDYRLMLRSLASTTTRVVVSRKALLDLLERSPRQIRLTISQGLLAVGDDAVPARVSGPAIDVGFDVTVLHPTITTSIGDDVMLDFAANDQPVQVRSADAGDLLMLAMPVRLDVDPLAE